MSVGFGSIYFHATLSLAGQLIDEIAIIWVIMGSWAMFMPSYILRKFIPHWVSRSHFRNGMATAAFILTGACCIKPEINHSALALFAFPCVGMTLSQVLSDIKCPFKEITPETIPLSGISSLNCLKHLGNASQLRRFIGS